MFINYRAKQTISVACDHELHANLQSATAAVLASTFALEQAVAMCSTLRDSVPFSARSKMPSPTETSRARVCPVTPGPTAQRTLTTARQTLV